MNLSLFDHRQIKCSSSGQYMTNVWKTRSWDELAAQPTEQLLCLVAELTKIIDFEDTVRTYN